LHEYGLVHFVIQSEKIIAELFVGEWTTWDTNFDFLLIAPEE